MIGGGSVAACQTAPGGERAAVESSQARALARASAAAASQAGASQDPNRIVCISGPPTGTRVSPQRVCMTAAEWEQQRRELQAAVEAGQRRRDLD